jgi:hypothetical protein
VVDVGGLLLKVAITPLAERLTSQTVAAARATKMRNTPRDTVWVAR